MFDDVRPIDLTLTIDERLPGSFPPHVPFVRRTWNWFDDEEHGPEAWTSHCGPYFTEVLIMDEHIATHFDAPGHFVRAHAPGQSDPIGGDEVPLDQFCGRAVVLDVTDVVGGRPGVSPFVGLGALERCEDRIGRRLGRGDVVLLRTDWDRRYYRPGREGRGYAHDVVTTGVAPGWPAPDVPVVEALLHRGVRCLGTDAPSMGAAHDGAPVHVTGLGGGMTFVEGLANLADVPPGAWFQFLPIKIARSSGGPGRAVAWVPM